jgi:hypothetical protein
VSKPIHIKQGINSPVAFKIYVNGLKMGRIYWATEHQGYVAAVGPYQTSSQDIERAKEKAEFLVWFWLRETVGELDNAG